MSRTVPFALVAVVAASIVLTACTSGTGEVVPSLDSSAESAGAPLPADPIEVSSEPDSSAEPVAAPEVFTADNCGFPVSSLVAPQRIVTVKSAMTELVLALGAGDRLVAIAYPDGAAPTDDPIVTGEVATGTAQDVAALTAALPVLAERVPSNEAVLATEPDLVLAGWESIFSADGAGERQALSDLGVTTFVAPTACTTAPYAPDPLTFDDVFAQIEQVGDLLGTSAEAQALVADLTTTLAEVSAPTATDGELPTVLWWSSGSDTPYVGAGAGAPQMILDAVGLANVAADLPGGWGPYSWEAAAAADPDYIVLVDSSWNAAETKKATLAANPVTAALPAVAQERYLVVPFAATEAGVRNVEAVTTLREQLAALGAP